METASEQVGSGLVVLVSRQIKTVLGQEDSGVKQVRTVLIIRVRTVSEQVGSGSKQIKTVSELAASGQQDKAITMVGLEVISDKIIK